MTLATRLTTSSATPPPPSRPVPGSRDWFRASRFGPEPQARDPWPKLLDACRSAADEWITASELVQASAPADSGDDEHADIRDLAPTVAATLPPARRAHEGRSAMGAPLRVVLMGRTQAGKSTLLEALSRGDGSRRGDGRQRYSRDVCVRQVADLAGVEIVDTPGVGAADGKEDFDRAFQEVNAADVILWVASNNSVQEETAVALRSLGFLGKPVIVALNCRWDLNHAVKRLDFMDDTGVAFRDVTGDVEAIEAQLARAGVRSVRVVTLHAEAAFRATQGSEDSPLLAARSGVEALYQALRVERDESGEQRKVLRVVDQLRGPMTCYQAGLEVAAADLTGRVAVVRRVGEDLRQRMVRQVDRHDDLLAERLRATVDKRREWHLNVDLGDDVNAAWTRESKRLSSEIDAAVKESLASLRDAMAEVSEQVTSDWQALPRSERLFGGLPRSWTLWMNRASRLGIAVAVGLGAISVSLVLPVMGPLLTLGARAGAATLLNTLAGPLRKATERVFPGRAAVARLRRAAVEKQIHRLLDEIIADLDEWRSTNTTTTREGLTRFFRAREEALLLQDGIAEQWACTAGRVGQAVANLDVATAIALLTLAGRPRLADGVQRAARLPGVAVAVEYTDDTLPEAVFYPPEGVTETITSCGPTGPGWARWPALPLVLGLVSGPVALDASTPPSVRLHLLEDDVPAGIRDAWAELVSQFTSTPTTITGPGHTAPGDEEGHQ